MCDSEWVLDHVPNVPKFASKNGSFIHTQCPRHFNPRVTFWDATIFQCIEGHVYTKQQHQHCDNSEMMLAILFSLKSMESFENGLQLHFGVILLFSMRTESLASLQSCCSVDADTWCKRTLRNIHKFCTSLCVPLGWCSTSFNMWYATYRVYRNGSSIYTNLHMCSGGTSCKWECCPAFCFVGILEPSIWGIADKIWTLGVNKPWDEYLV